MNIQRILKLADYIEASPNQFNMTDYRCCVYGFMQQMRAIPFVGGPMTSVQEMADYLDIGLHNANHVIHPVIREEVKLNGGVTFSYSPVYPERETAVKMLRNLAATGEVDWELAISQTVPVDREYDGSPGSHNTVAHALGLPELENA